MKTFRHPNGYRILLGSQLLTITGTKRLTPTGTGGKGGALYYRTTDHAGKTCALLGVHHLNVDGFTQDDRADVLQREAERGRMIREDHPECISKTGWICIPKEVQAVLPKVENAERSRVEMWDFLDDKPRRYFAYVKDATDETRTRYITTYMGDKLGVITHFSSSYRCGFGFPWSRRRNIEVRGFNGVRYWGIYCESSGDYCRLTAYKNQ